MIVSTITQRAITAFDSSIECEAKKVRSHANGLNFSGISLSKFKANGTVWAKKNSAKKRIKKKIWIEIRIPRITLPGCKLQNIN